MLPVVLRANLRQGALAPTTLQRAGGLERGLTRTGVGLQHDRHQSTNIPRIDVQDRGSETDGDDHRGARQRTLPTPHRLHRLRRQRGPRTPVPTVVLAQSEPDRTAVEIHQVGVPLSPALRQLCRFP